MVKGNISSTKDFCSQHTRTTLEMAVVFLCRILPSPNDKRKGAVVQALPFIRISLLGVSIQKGQMPTRNLRTDRLKVPLLLLLAAAGSAFVGWQAANKIYGFLRLHFQGLNKS